MLYQARPLDLDEVIEANMKRVSEVN